MAHHDASLRSRRTASARRRPDLRARLRARAFIDRRYATSLTMGRIAAQAGFSRCHFIRLFRGAFGLTPYQYLKTRRLERAKELLATTILSVMDVCLDVGFESLGSFTSLFTRAVGETPGAYRAARRRRVCIPYCFVRMYRAEPLADATWAMGT